MPGFKNYPTTEDGNAMRYYRLFFEEEGYNAAIQLLIVGKQRKWRMVRVLLVHVDFLIWKEICKRECRTKVFPVEEDFLRSYTKRRGDLLCVLEDCSQLMKERIRANRVQGKS